MLKDGKNRVPGSFRDPNGYLFYQDGELFRQINVSYQSSYELMKETGLMEFLIKNLVKSPKPIT